jgi:PhnB protein
MPTIPSQAAQKAAAHGVSGLSPHLVCADAASAIDFYEKALGAETLFRLDGPDGKIMHACLSINGASIMLAEERQNCAALSPVSLNGTPVTLHQIVDDADAAAARMADAGGMVIMPVEEMFWGDRYGIVADPFGHRWSFATPVKQLSPDEILSAADKAMTEMTRSN